MAGSRHHRRGPGRRGAGPAPGPASGPVGGPLGVLRVGVAGDPMGGPADPGSALCVQKGAGTAAGPPHRVGHPWPADVQHLAGGQRCLVDI